MLEQLRLDALKRLAEQKVTREQWNDMGLNRYTNDKSPYPIELDAASKNIALIKGNLIELAQNGSFQVITHSCNCFCRMKRGIAPQLAKAFGCNRFSLERKEFEGDLTKLGNIEWQEVNGVLVVNSYMQYHWTTPSRFGFPFDYDACRLCLRKINSQFRTKSVGMPWIGCGLAGACKEEVLQIISDELKDCRVTIVELP